jgi:circadian clock protein KaiC
MAEQRGAAPERLASGVPGLDRILGGGLLTGSLAMVIGAPGTGKTLLAEQVAFHQAARGATALYLTGYSETHDKLLRHGRGLSFFRPELIGTRVQFASLTDLMRAGADKTEDAIVAMARAQRASLVVLDGFRGLSQLLADGQEAADFLYSLGAKLALLGVTTLVIVESDPDDASRYGQVTVCDVLLGLRRELRGTRQRRLLEVLKARGAAPLNGLHPFEIGPDGLALFPRFESVAGPPAASWVGGRASLGSPPLDALLGGGPHVGTTTLVAGTPGVGKTLLGLHFATAGARAGDPTLFLGLVESAAQLRAMAGTFGMDLAASEAAGHLRLLALLGYDLEADYLAHAIAEDVERRGVRRLVIDSATELERAIGDGERKAGFLAALVGYLRARDVTTYVTLDIPTIVGPALDLAGTPLSVVAENLLLLRSVEYRGRLHRVLSVVKMRFSDHERAIYEFEIAAGQGIRLLGPAPLGEGFLTGLARLPGEPRPPRPGDGAPGEP